MNKLRIEGNLEVALKSVCKKLPGGGNHEIRKRVAEALLQAAKTGHTNLRKLELVGRKTLREADRRSA